MNVKKFFTANFPLTYGGTLFFLIAVITLFSGITRNSSAAALVGFLGLFLLGILLLFSLSAKRRRSAGEVSWFLPNPIRTFSANQKLRVTLPWKNAPMFFRYHHSFFGRNISGTEIIEPFRFGGTSSPGGTFQFTVYFRFSGLLSGYTAVHLRDIFGLTKSLLQVSEKKSVPVVPGIISNIPKESAESSSGTGEDQLKRISEDMKYFMREYIPGDRYRDINWKATLRVEELITRTAPVTNREVKIIPVFLLHACTEDAERYRFYEAALHLEATKSWLLTFISRILDEESDYIFDIYTDTRTMRVQDHDDLEMVYQMLGGTGFVRRMHIQPAELPQGAVIFTTPYQPGIFSGALPGGCRVMKTVSWNGESPDLSIPFREIEVPRSLLIRDSNFLRHLLVKKNKGEESGHEDRKLKVFISRGWLW
ncbi:MAG: DUF58 domain-containing protein [Spirochaetia bacterium]